MPERIMIVEDDRELRVFLAEVLEDAGYAPVPFPDADAALRAVREGEAFDLVVTDLVMPGTRGHELLRELRRCAAELNVIIVTAFGSIDSAIELVKAGAYDYLTKPVGIDDLLLSVERGLGESRLRRELARLARAPSPTPPGFIAASRPMQELFRLIERAGRSHHPVLITGESGTGKELAARALHQISGRDAFVAVNCAALPDNLLESELFGHEKGAFTGADRERAGLFEAAHRGTIFLDEIAELPRALQPKLLRALENGEVRRLGAAHPRNLDVRLVAATNKDLEDDVRNGHFRDDLFWRLNVLHLHIPPLRERPADIPLLAEHFLELAAGPGRERPRGIAPDAMALLTAYPWPGNVRELRNAIERAATLATGDVIRPEDLPPRIRAAGSAAFRVSDASRRHLSLRDLERAYIAEVLRQVGGNKSRAARILGLDRKTLYRKLQEHRQGDPTPAL